MAHNEVIKASGCIHISHRLSLVQQQLWNLLLSKAYNDLLVKKEHVIPVTVIRNYLGNTRNHKHLKRLLAGLDVQVYYNILNKDSSKWGFFSLLAYAEIEDGLCRYAFVEEIRSLLYNPKFYAKVSLIIQKRFRSKYALFLYELCIDYIGIAQTPWITLKDFRSYMGLEKSEYPGFKSLRQHVIEKALLEINNCSDITITADYNRGGRWITDIKFSIVKKECKTTAPALSMQEGGDEIAAQLIQFGIPVSKVPELISCYTPESIQQKISLLKENKAKVHNSGAWLLKALEENWNSVSYDKQQEVIEKKERERKATIEKEQRRQFTETLKKEYDLFIEELAEQRYQALSDHERNLLDEKFESWIIKNKTSQFFHFLSESTRRLSFLIEELVQPHEKNFINWTQQRSNL